MKKQIVVIGLGRFGISVATTLSSIGHDVLAIDKEEVSVQNIAPQVTHAIQADATNESVLKELGIGNFEIAIVAMGTAIESNVLSTILLKKLGVRYVIARANDELHGSILEKIGADIVIYPEREMGTRVAHGVTLIDVSDYMTVAPGYGVAKLAVPPHIVGERLSGIGFGSEGEWKVAVLLIQRGKEVIVTPGQREVIKADDVLVLAGSDENLEKLLAGLQKNTTEQ